MRVLDLGAHDGFVGAWLEKQIGDIHIDGVEANSEAVRIGNERNKTGGRYVQGLAEEAAQFFDTHSYDAVVAFELIEHVPDVNHFLDSIELMVKDGGRVYLSTPDGCFGEGNNPHHLRVYRAVDLFELCRRRGQIKNMVAGSDGVTVICYSPSFAGLKPEFGIYVGPGWEKWHPSDIATKGLGGSETAAIKLAEALSEWYTVTVYGECDYCAWRQVSFKPHHTFDALESREALIVSRMPHVADRPMDAGRKLLWMHDTDYGPAMTKERLDKFDDILVLSEWHRGFVAEQYPTAVDPDKLVVFGNAIEPRYFRDGDGGDRKPVALYTSSPDRGLDLLLGLWPRVRAELPEAELHFAYASVYHKIAEKDPTVAKFREKILQLADQPGIVDLGSLSQPQVAKKMQEVTCWLAPSVHTPSRQLFYETYCIGAQEAAAGGANVIASAWGALPERCEQAVNSILIPNMNWETFSWEDEWVASIVNGMSYPVNQPSNLALTTTWEVRAQQIKALIESGIPAPA